jgi:hypothetical protein
LGLVLCSPLPNYKKVFPLFSSLLKSIIFIEGVRVLIITILNVGNIKFGLGDPDFVLKQDIYYV